MTDFVEDSFPETVLSNLTGDSMSVPVFVPSSDSVTETPWVGARLSPELAPPVVAPAAPMAPASKGPGLRELRRRTPLLGLPVDNVSIDEAVNLILNRLRQTTPTRACFINADCVNVAWRNAEYRRLVRSADLSFADGVGLRIAGRWLRRPLRDNVNGTDLFPVLCEGLQKTSHRVFLLGGRPGVAADVAEWIDEKFPGVTVCGVRSGFYAPEDEAAVVREIAETQPDLLLVGLGEPRQTEWVARNLKATGATVGMGVGGLFDFYSGRIPRAPEWFRRHGLEWAYRMWQEPKRLWRRYVLGNSVFLTRLAAIRLRRKLRSLSRSR
jgi:N-acetylglucosaminyldiphosphoundecaprenol N-acetyl-beta-D-mannosaminyltransferase